MSRRSADMTEYGPQDFYGGRQAPAQRAADLGRADAPAITDRDLTRAQSRARRAQLHLDSPAIIAVAHPKCFQRGPPNRAEGAQIRVMNASHSSDEPNCERVAES